MLVFVSSFSVFLMPRLAVSFRWISLGCCGLTLAAFRGFSAWVDWFSVFLLFSLYCSFFFFLLLLGLRCFEKVLSLFITRVVNLFL
ncbi:hypothetical protein BZA77DRAFT_46180 [Pyronema omphalodes]|nr:hypothetical protein BZA77DRAFT_46180 [Pyronema omphalodes]